MVTALSAHFKVSEHAQLEDLISVAKNWIFKSPHYQVNMHDLASIEKECSALCLNQTSTASSIKYEDSKGKNWGLQIRSVDTNEIFTSELVGHKTKEGFEVSVLVDYKSVKLGNSGGIKKPRIIDLIIENLHGGPDGTLLVKNQPYRIEEKDLSTVADAINARGQNTLPIVYLSKDSREALYLDPVVAARNFTGIAHVFVEPTHKFSYFLREKTNNRNAHSGVIGVYWPTGHFSRIPVNQHNTTDLNFQMVWDEVNAGSVKRFIPERLSYSGVERLSNHEKNMTMIRESLNLDQKHQDEALKIAIDEIEKARGSHQIVVDSLQNIITDLTQQLHKCSLSSGGVIDAPEYPLLYSNEVNDVVLDVLSRSISNLSPGSRREEIIKAVLQANPTSDTREEMYEKLTSIFKENRFREREISDLIGLGFGVEKMQNGHYKIFVPGKEGIFVTCAATPSDYRARKNEYSDLKKSLL